MLFGCRSPDFYAMKTRKLAFCGIIACLYAVVTLTTSAFAFGPIQFRVAEVLCMLCFFTPSAIWAVTAGCFLANLFSPLPLDLLFGTLATLVGCLGAARCKNPWVIPLPVALANAVIVGAELAIAFYPAELFLTGIIISGLQVAIGEFAVLYVLGVPLLKLLQRSSAAEFLHTL
ncbi:MAG: QueT transporter family protein [Oscillospiraceae bacterium]|nr:QueT transporter family protein [Oscillospiraceae bacterium]